MMNLDIEHYSLFLSLMKLPPRVFYLIDTLEGYNKSNQFDFLYLSIHPSILPFFLHSINILLILLMEAILHS